MIDLEKTWQGLRCGAWLSLCMGVALSSCKKNEQEQAVSHPAAARHPATPPTAQAPATPTPSTSTSAVSTPDAGRKMRLLDPGREPRRKIAILPKRAGDVRSVVLSFDGNIEARTDKQKKTMSIPSVLCVIEETVVSVNDDGYVLRQVFKKLESESAASLPGMDQYRSLAGSVVTAKYGRNGVMISHEMTLAPGADPKIAAMIREQMGAPVPLLPDAPLGVGAKWETTASSHQGGLQLTFPQTWEIKAIDAETVRLTHQQPGHTVTHKIPGSGQSVEMTFSTNGKFTLALDWLRGFTGESTVSAETKTLAKETPMNFASKMKMRVDAGRWAKPETGLTRQNGQRVP